MIENKKSLRDELLDYAAYVILLICCTISITAVVVFAWYVITEFTKLTLILVGVIAALCLASWAYIRIDNNRWTDPNY